MEYYNSNEIRVRFAPSPTGYLHIGGLRTALYNFLIAKKHNGRCILRIEDTDQTRYVEGAVENLISSLSWAGIEFDEGPHIGGTYGPYIQSKRIDLYQKFAKELVQEEKAYYCFCTSERLDVMRKNQSQKNETVKYDRTCKNLSKEEVQNNLKNGIPHTIRLLIPDGISSVDDLIRGKVEFQNELIDDQVLIKSDGFPTYHLANVIDDHLMNISDVIRGEEWLPSTPKHVILYNYFGWKIPRFAHLPLLLNPDKSKLSKRQGDVAVEDYRSKGYLKEALVNFIALLGWNAGDDIEYYSLNELIEKFSLERVNKSGAIFNVEKLNWLNAEHLRRKSNEEILILLKEELKKSEFNNNNYSDDYLLKIVRSMKERVSFVNEFISKAKYFYDDVKNYDESVIKKRWKSDTGDLLKSLISSFEILENPDTNSFEIALREAAERLNIGAGKIIHGVRIALSGIGDGPGVFELLDILGKEESIKRIQNAINIIKV